MANYSSGGGLNSIPPVVRTIMIVNAIVFILQQVIPGLTEWGALHYWTSSLFKPHQIVTMMFLHGGIWHIAFNMLALYIAGSTLENFWGAKRFFNFYMICGIGASLITLLTVPLSAGQLLKRLGGDSASAGEVAQFLSQYYQQYSALGASGAIMGAMAAFAYLFPNTELYIYGMFPVKVKYLVPGYILIDLFGGFGYKAMQGDNVAHWAHIGGALTGLLIVIIWNKSNRKNFY